jgi:uncharacterized protein (DUF362 family)
MDNPKTSTVSIVRADTAVYDDIEFDSLVQSCFTDLEKSGIQIPTDGTVFIKPNAVAGFSSRSSITTEPELIASTIRLLKGRGVKKVYVGDSSASYIPSRDTFQQTGLMDVIVAAGAEFVDIDSASETVDLPLPDSHLIASLKIARKALEADCLINFGKLKTHRIASSITCTVKNYVGFIPQDVRLAYHQTRLPKLVAELHQAMPARLHFADAIIVGEGDGPDLSKPRYLGVMLGSNDPVALDSIAAELVGVHRSDLLFAWTAYYEGVGQIERRNIKVIGPDIRDIAIRIEKPVSVLYNRFPCNVVLGAMCDGCFAWFQGPALFWERDGIWQQINANCGRPTFMIGFNAEDLKFEPHLAEGPYFVVGDCAPQRFRNDPRTIHIAGCCPGPAIPDTVLKHCKIQ